MPREIWKYDIDEGQQFIKMPKGAKHLTVQMQHNTPRIWVIVDPNADREDRLVSVIGTGHSIPDSRLLGEYVGTFQLANGLLVFHVFIA